MYFFLLVSLSPLFFFHFRLIFIQNKWRSCWGAVVAEKLHRTRENFNLQSERKKIRNSWRITRSFLINQTWKKIKKNKFTLCSPTSKPLLIIHYFRECFHAKIFSLCWFLHVSARFESNRHEAKVAYIIGDQSRGGEITSFAIFRSLRRSL